MAAPQVTLSFFCCPNFLHVSSGVSLSLGAGQIILCENDFACLVQLSSGKVSFLTKKSGQKAFELIFL